MEETVYKIVHCMQGYFVARKCAMDMSGTLFFWQQVSPYYQRKGNAKRFATKRNIPLIGPENIWFNRKGVER